MNPISAEIVESTWQEMSQLTPESVFPLVDEFSKKQPDVLAYLMAAGGDIFSEYERELLFYVGVVVWRMMSRGDHPLPMISLPEIEKAEDANYNTLEALAGDSEGDFIVAAENMFRQYNQVEVLRYVVEAIMEDEENEETISEESKGLMLIVLKTVIDCFDAA